MWNSFLPKHQYYNPTKKKSTKSLLVLTSKNRKNRGKTNCAKFFTKNNFLFFVVEFFTKEVLKPLLRGRETVRKKYPVVFEKFPKNMFFFRLCVTPHVQGDSAILKYSVTSKSLLNNMWYRVLTLQVLNVRIWKLVMI